jgi:serine/threonine protein phosphatase PrpC
MNPTQHATEDFLKAIKAFLKLIGRNNSAGFYRRGRANEDTVCKCSFKLNGKTYTLMFVLDGHGSPSLTQISNEIVIETEKYLPALILQYLSEGASAEDAIKNAHLKLQAYFEDSNDFWNGGTCIGGALIFGNTCVAFNLGDITVGLVDSKGNHRELSKHHNAANPEERKRLEDLGINITEDGRIGGPRGIMVSGALGDKDFSHYLSKIPHIETITLSPGDKIFVASDGVTGGVIFGRQYGLTIAEVANLVHENCDAKKIVDAAIASLNWVHPSSVDDASMIIFSLGDSNDNYDYDDDAQAPLSAGIGCNDD